jgi:hypothetical protein
MRPGGRERSFGSCVTSAYHQSAVKVVILTASMDGIAQQRDEWEYHSEQRSIAKSQAQANRHDSTLFLAQHIAYAPDGVDQAWLPPGFQLLAQLLDIDLYHILTKIIAPYPVEQDILGKHLPWMNEKLLEHLEFEACEGNCALAPADIVATSIHGQISKA